MTHLLAYACLAGAGVLLWSDERLPIRTAGGLLVAAALLLAFGPLIERLAVFVLVALAILVIVWGLYRWRQAATRTTKARVNPNP